MTDELEKVLRDSKATRETVLEVMKGTVAELSGAAESEMRASLISAIGNDQFRIFEEQFRKDPVALGDAAQLYLSNVWSDPVSRPVVRANIEAADENLALVETAILALVAMYAMYLLATKGVLEETVRETKKADGSAVAERTTTKVGFAEPVRALIGLLKSPLAGKEK